jgi:hypothetical protein
MCNPLPISVSALKQNFHAHLNRKWAEKWSTSPRKARIEQLEDDFPFNGFRKRLFQLKRKHASLAVQLRIGHIPLNGYLKRIGKVNTDNCTECNKEHEDDPIPETVKHFLFECPAHTRHRRKLRTKIGRSRFNLSKIMSDTDHLKALADYVQETGRFNNKNQE